MSLGNGHMSSHCRTCLFLISPKTLLMTITNHLHFFVSALSLSPLVCCTARKHAQMYSVRHGHTDKDKHANIRKNQTRAGMHAYNDSLSLSLVLSLAVSLIQLSLSLHMYVRIYIYTHTHTHIYIYPYMEHPPIHRYIHSIYVDTHTCGLSRLIVIRHWVW